jgi:hypothetical protein
VEGVEVPAAADRVGCLRDREALVRTGRVDDVPGPVQLEGEVADDPVVGEGVVDDHRIAEVVGVAQVAEGASAHE